MGKRIFDIVLAVIVLVVAAPLLALIALAVKLDSPGRAIFSQERLGQGGVVFRIHKFRKFPDNWGARGAGVTVAGDARMTRLGRFLERSKFDELPQLWNILKGEMSFVGPRPESLLFADLFTGELARVHDYKPGVFGPNQVAYRNESDMYPPDRDPDAFYRSELFPAKARNDVDYFARATLFSDIGWMLRGVWVSLVEAIHWKLIIRQRGVHVSYDISATAGAWMVATLLRFEGLPSGGHWQVFVLGLWLLPLLIVPLLVVSGCYRQPVRHFSLGAAARIFAALTVGYTFFAVLAMLFVYRSISITVLLLAASGALVLMLGARFYYRERWLNRRKAVNGNGHAVRIAIYGAGRRGGALAALINQGFPDASLVGFIDDGDHEMHGREIHGRRVLGCERDLNTIHSVYGLEQIWVTFVPNAPKRHRLRAWCAEHAVKLVVLPEAEPFRALAALRAKRRRVLPLPDSPLQRTVRLLRHRRPAVCKLHYERDLNDDAMRCAGRWWRGAGATVGAF